MGVKSQDVCSESWDRMDNSDLNDCPLADIHEYNNYYYYFKGILYWVSNMCSYKSLCTVHSYYK